MTTFEKISTSLARLSEQIRTQHESEKELESRLGEVRRNIEKLKVEKLALESKKSVLEAKHKGIRQEANAIGIYARKCLRFIITEFNERPIPTEAVLKGDSVDYFSLTPEVRTVIERKFGSNISDLVDFVTNKFDLFKSSEDLVFELPSFTEIKEVFGQEAVIAVAHIIKIGSVYTNFRLETTSNNFVGVFANKIGETLQWEFNIPDDELGENQQGNQCQSFYRLLLNEQEIESSTWYLQCLDVVYCHNYDCLENEGYGIDINSQIELACSRLSPRFVGLQ